MNIHAFAALLNDTNENRGINAMLNFDSDSDECLKEENYDPEDLEEMKERSVPFFGGDEVPDQTIHMPNASATIHPNNLK